jgi:hypothetical protein
MLSSRNAAPTMILHGPAVMTDAQKLEFMREWLMNVSRAMQDLRIDVENFCEKFGSDFRGRASLIRPPEWD